MEHRTQNIEHKMRATDHRLRNISVPCSVLRVSSRRGFAMMFAILASTVLLSVSVAIWNIALREIVFSSFGRESQIAFYATDTGIECALFWDFKGAFATSTDSSSDGQITCGGQTISISSDRDNRSSTSTFRLTSGICADVTVAKSDPDGDGSSATQIESRGHNTCNVSDPTYVERGLRVNY